MGQIVQKNIIKIKYDNIFSDQKGRIWEEPLLVWVFLLQI